MKHIHLKPQLNSNNLPFVGIMLSIFNYCHYHLPQQTAAQRDIITHPGTSSVLAFPRRLYISQKKKFWQDAAGEGLCCWAQQLEQWSAETVLPPQCLSPGLLQEGSWDETAEASRWPGGSHTRVVSCTTAGTACASRGRSTSNHTHDRPHISTLETLLQVPGLG